MNQKEITKLVKKNLHPDTITKKRTGTILCRWGFFYTCGKTSEDYVNLVSDFLKNRLVSFRIINHGMIWKNFKGGAPVARQSHFYVEFELL